MTCALSAEIDKPYWPRNDSLAKSERGYQGCVYLEELETCSAQESVRWVGQLPMTLGLHWWSLALCVDQESSGALRAMLSMRTAVADVYREGKALPPLSMESSQDLLSRGPCRDCIEALLLGKCNEKYSCSFLKIPCISHANGVSFPGDTDPSYHHIFFKLWLCILLMATLKALLFCIPTCATTRSAEDVGEMRAVKLW